MDLLDTVKKNTKTLMHVSSWIEADEDTDILDKLKEEHDQVKNLLTELVKSNSAAGRKQLLHKIKLALVPHSRAEEKIVYDAIIAKNENTAKIDGEEGYFEHAAADNMLTKLSKITNTLSPEFSAGAKVLKEMIEHHIDEEEKNVWKDVRIYFDSEERVEMNRKFEMAKKKVRVAS